MVGHTKCFVANCKSNYNSKRDGYVSVFAAKKPQLLAWRVNIPKRAGIVFETKHKICAHHFTPDSYKDTRILIQGEWVPLPFARKQLKIDAVPTIFPGFPNHRIKPARKPPVQRKAPPPKVPKEPKYQYQPQDKQVELQEAPPVVFEDVPVENTANTDAIQSTEETKFDLSLSSPPTSLFDRVLKSFETKDFALPYDWKDFINRQKNIITICKFEMTADNIPKQNQISIVLNKNGDRCIKACSKNLIPTHELSVELCNVTDCKLLQALIKRIDMCFKVCQGSEIDNDEKQHYCGCQLLLSKGGSIKRCVQCMKEKKRIYSEKRYNEARVEHQKKKRDLQKIKMHKLKLKIKSMSKTIEVLERQVPSVMRIGLFDE